MDRKRMILVGLGLFAVSLPGLVYAEDAPQSPHTITANVGLYSQYVFRGLTQSAEKPAIQGGMDYSHSSGFYAGFWASNIGWLEDVGAYSKSSLELDLYGGYRNSFGNSGVSYDIGILRYVYPGSTNSGFIKADTTEIYGALSYKWIAGKLSYSVDDTFGVADSKGSWYGDLSANIPFGESGFTLVLHVGYQKFEGTVAGQALGFADNSDLLTYSDYKVSLTKSFDKGFSAGIAVTGTDAKDAGYTILGKNIGDTQVAVFVGRSF